MLAAITPEVLFSGAQPSANGLEMALGLLLWAALLAAVRQRSPDRAARYLAVAFAAAVPLTFLRMLGPFWILVIVLSVAAYAGWGTSAASSAGTGAWSLSGCRRSRSAASGGSPGR